MIKTRPAAYSSLVSAMIAARTAENAQPRQRPIPHWEQDKEDRLADERVDAQIGVDRIERGGEG